MKYCGEWNKEGLKGTCGQLLHGEIYKCPECVRHDHDAMAKDMIRLKIAVRAILVDELDMKTFVKQVHKIAMTHAHGEHLK